MVREAPIARSAGLLVRDLGDEVVLYEVESHRAHCLNRTAALVWRACDGRRTAAAIAEQLKHAGVPADRALVDYALGRLRDTGLLEAGARGTRHIGRREAALRIGAGLLPVVASIVSPTPGEAASCPGSCPACSCAGKADGTTCWNGTDCSSYVCCSYVCQTYPCP